MMENDDMSYLKEQAEWTDGIYQIETSDPVLGGPDGITNRPARELANRTVWLKQQLKDAEAALTAHTRSRNHPDASLSEKGFVKLSNANQSSSETEAATPKAVKIVNDRLNAVVDSAPSDLDTLNKLAKAISNNPKFAESVTQLLSQKLGKNENGADIPDKNLFLKNLGLLETVDCAKNALDKRTGGTVNGDIISQGGQLLLKGDNRKHLGFHNQDGSVRMWLYKDKGGDGVHLNNGNDGGGDWVFNKNGHFYSPQALHAADATYQEDGNIHGPMWGGHISGWIIARANEAQSNAWQHADHLVNSSCVLNVQLGARQVNPGFAGRFDTPGGCVITSAHGDSDNWISAQYAPIQIWKNNQWVTIAG